MHKKPKPFKETQYVETLKNDRAKSGENGKKVIPPLFERSDPVYVFEIQERRRRVARLYCMGHAQWEIAKIENVSDSVITNDLHTIQETWKSKYSADVHDLKMAELAKIDEIERLAFEAYKRSCEIKRVVTKEKIVGGKDGTVYKDKVVREQLIGSDAFLNRISWCSEQRCKILGITKDQVKVTTNIVAVPWDQIVASTGGAEINNTLAELEALPAVELKESNEHDNVQSGLSSENGEE